MMYSYRLHSSDKVIGPRLQPKAFAGADHIRIERLGRRTLIDALNERESMKGGNFWGWFPFLERNQGKRRRISNRDCGGGDCSSLNVGCGCSYCKRGSAIPYFSSIFAPGKIGPTFALWSSRRVRHQLSRALFDTMGPHQRCSPLALDR
jgi:hypothetical protein